MIDAAEASLWVALVALAGTIANGLLTFIAARRTAFNTAVTVERSKWIASIKNSIEEVATNFNDFVFRERLRQHVMNEVAIADAAKLLSSTNRLLLQLNPEGVIEKKIVQLLETIDVYRAEMSAAVGQDAVLLTAFRELTVHLEIFVEHCRWLLKMEWERVKIEASPWPRKGFLLLKSRRLMRDYRSFAQEDGFFIARRSALIGADRQRLRDAAPRVFRAQRST